MATEIYSQFKIKIFLLISTTCWVVFTVAECDYYLAPSKNPQMGRAVIAGRDFEPDSIATTAPGLVVPSESIEDTQLENYVFAVYDFESETSVSGYSKILFGTAMMYNHNNDKALEHHSASDDAALVEVVDEAQSSFSSDTFTFTTSAETGDEVFSYYGQKWFKHRDISMLEPGVKMRYSKDDLEKYGHCLSDAYVSQSSLPLGGSGLFAAKSFRQGEVVSVSPALLLRLNSLAMETVLANYVYASPGCDYALLPIALPAMINHQPEDVANVKVRWMTSKALTVNPKASSEANKTFSESIFPAWTRKSPEEIASALSAQVDLEYVALRDIAAGEELCMFYGRSWEATWSLFLAARLEMERELAAEGWIPQGNRTRGRHNHRQSRRHLSCLATERSRLNGDDKRYQGNAFVDTMFSSLHNNLTDQELAAVGKFRHPIEAPNGLFPVSWFGLHHQKEEKEEVNLKENASAAVLADLLEVADSCLTEYHCSSSS